MLGSTRKEQFSLQALQILDGFLVWLGFALSSALRNEIKGAEAGVNLSSITWLLFVVVPFTPLVLELFGFYRNTLTLKASTALSKLLQSTALMGALVGAAVIIFQLDPSSRLVLLVGGILVITFIFLRFVWVRNVLRRRVKNGASRERVILAGSHECMEKFLGDLPENVSSYIEVRAQFDLLVKDPEELVSLIEQESAQRVIISPQNIMFEKVSQTVEVCEAQGLEVWVAADFIRSQLARPAFDTMGSTPMLVLRSTPELSWALLTKSLFDRFVALIVIIGSAPLWVFAALGIYFSDRGPVFFKQKRSGKYGKEFNMWKFRTMVVDAEAKLAEVKKQMGNQMSGPVFKLDDDPRVFKFAKFLRKTSIDELPQLFNVLMGDMSLVGPRPLPVYEVKEFSKATYRRRLSVKPGITCTWQAGGRNTITDFEEWVEMDLAYIDNWTLWLDLKILLKTIPAVLFSKGAK